MFYPEELVEEIRSRNDIVDVISSYVKLQKKGSTYFGLCPFHNEKTPSFSVTPSKQMYYCFGCGAGGNVITFLMEYENYTFKEALTWLADRAGIELPKEEESAEAKKQADLRARILEVNREAGKYFYYQMKGPGGKRAYEYLRGRGLSDDTIRRFGLGYSNMYSDDLYRYLKKKGYDDELLKETGLVKVEERGAHDRFWNRVMFPIMDVNGRIIGFGGRVMGDGEPKYLNSPETKAFDKSRNLYGLNYARTARKPYMLICEGYMDVISMHQAGFSNAVASLGTAFTSGQASLLRRYTDQVVLTYDSDGAGIKAALRAIPILKEAGLSARVLNLKPYKDPDEFIKNLGPEAFEERISQAKNSFLFETDVLYSQYDMKDPEQKTAFHNALAKKLLQFPEKLERENYMEAAARQYYIEFESLKSLVNSMGGRVGLAAEKPVQVKRENKKDKPDGVRQSQRILLTWLIEDERVYPAVKGILEPEDFTEELYRKVAAMVYEGLERGTLTPAGILSHFINDEEEYKEVAALFNTSLSELTREEKERAFSETVKRVKRYSLEEKSRSVTDIASLQKLIQEQAKINTLHISLN
ncbi:DNA primase [Fusibacillus kribbianus]|uniref:DNA primase n=1 Tax=Fusibacillus kribbianus TaxID=3044208 RepID=A0AAP4B859_9FIRM|nr:DNA primase [Ruminococcus sp. YH-rum2234]MDI9241400.1 DNA primase [Ruminococcus sp. YH-rum2234]